MYDVKVENKDFIQWKVQIVVDVWLWQKEKKIIKIDYACMQTQITEFTLINIKTKIWTTVLYQSFCDAWLLYEQTDIKVIDLSFPCGSNKSVSFWIHGCIV